MKHDHTKTPFFTKLVEYTNSDVVPFDVPGHRMGTYPKQFDQALKKYGMSLDVNAPKGLDNLHNPQGVIADAERLMADAYFAKHAFFLVNGSSGGILAMIMATVNPQEKIIVPRNIHKSVLNGMILSGALPVFITPDIDVELGIAGGVYFKDVKETIDENLDAKVLLLINPTYFGAVSDLEKIIEYAHQKGLIVLVDSAHGAHFSFCSNFPLPAIKAGADLVTLSLHKTSGSLTQSSILLSNTDKISPRRIRSTINMLQSTSPSMILLASLDVARKYLVLEGEKVFNEVISLANSARIRLKENGIRVLDEDYFSKRGFDFDRSKLVVDTSSLGMSGFSLYRLLGSRYNIQAELAETMAILFVFGIGTDQKSTDYLVNCLIEIKASALGNHHIEVGNSFYYPPQAMAPREAYFSIKNIIPLEDSLGRISAESLMIYPPGIPLLVPGEVITKEVLETFNYYIKQGGVILKDGDDQTIAVVAVEE